MGGVETDMKTEAPPTSGMNATVCSAVQQTSVGNSHRTMNIHKYA